MDVRCIDGNLGAFGYNPYDTTCSQSVVMAAVNVSRCRQSGSDEGAYVLTTCTDLNDISGSAAAASLTTTSLAIVGAAVTATMTATLSLFLHVFL